MKWKKKEMMKRERERTMRKKKLLEIAKTNKINRKEPLCSCKQSGFQ